MNHVDSYGNNENIFTGQKTTTPSRYPNHSTLNQYVIFAQDMWKVNPQLNVETGLRYSWVTAEAKFDKNFYNFLFSEAKTQNSALSGSLGLHID